MSLSSGTGARVGEARGVEGVNRVANISSLSSLVWVVVVVVLLCEDEGSGMREGISFME